MNNYEKIKNMTLDEMAEFMQIVNVESLCKRCLGCDSEDEEIGCDNGIKLWLQQESEDNQ